MSDFVRSPNLWIPKELKPANKPISVVFYHSPKLNHITVGIPEQYPVPPLMQAMGYQKVVCRSAHEVSIWSQKLRDQEKREEQRTDEQREAIEGPIRAKARAELLSLASNARNQFNRDFCLESIRQIDEEDRRQKVKRESFQHIEGYEAGHGPDPTPPKVRVPTKGMIVPFPGDE